MKTAALRTCLVAAVLGCSAAAFADVGELSCTSAAGATITANVTYYDIGLTPSSTGDESKGAGAGKITFNPVVLHLPLADFLTFVQPAEEGTTFSACKLTTQEGRTTIQYDFKLVAVASIDAVSEAGSAGRNGAFSYTDLKLTFGSLEIQTSRTAPQSLRH